MSFVCLSGEYAEGSRSIAGVVLCVCREGRDGRDAGWGPWAAKASRWGETSERSIAGSVCSVWSRGTVSGQCRLQLPGVVAEPCVLPGRYCISLEAWDDRGDRLACLRRKNMVEVVL